MAKRFLILVITTLFFIYPRFVLAIEIGDTKIVVDTGETQYVVDIGPWMLSSTVFAEEGQVFTCGYHPGDNYQIDVVNTHMRDLTNILDYGTWDDPFEECNYYLIHWNDGSLSREFYIVEHIESIYPFYSSFYRDIIYSATPPDIPVDSDGDGLPDDCDPKPYDADPFGYFRSFFQHDEAGNVTYEWLVLSDGTDVQMGSYYSGDGVQARICIDDGIDLATLHLDWAEKYCSQTVAPTFGQQTYSHAPAVSSATLAAGEIGTEQTAWDEKVSELEADAIAEPLDDVIKGMLQDAEAVLSNLNVELSKAIAELSAAISDLIAEINGGGDDFNAALLAQEARADTAAISAEQEITAATPNDTSYNTDLDVVDTTDDETAFLDAAENLQQDSPLSSVSDNIGIHVTGATASFTAHALGKDIIFDFSPYESFYDVMGTLFIGICYLSAFLIVARS